MYMGHDLDLSRSGAIIGHMVSTRRIWLSTGVPLTSTRFILTRFRDMKPQTCAWPSWSNDVIGDMTIWFLISLCHFLWVLHWNLHSISKEFRDTKAQTYQGHVITTLTFRSHVTSSFTWPFDSQYVVSYRCSLGTNPLSWIVFWYIKPQMYPCPSLDTYSYSCQCECSLWVGTRRRVVHTVFSRITRSTDGDKRSGSHASLSVTAGNNNA